MLSILQTQDAASAVQWSRHYGLEVVFEQRFEPCLSASVEIKRSDAEIYLSEHTGDINPPGLLYIWIDSAEPLAALAAATTDEMPWARDFEIADPDGNRLRFAEPPSLDDSTVCS